MSEGDDASAALVDPYASGPPPPPKKKACEVTLAIDGAGGIPGTCTKV